MDNKNKIVSILQTIQSVSPHPRGNFAVRPYNAGFNVKNRQKDAIFSRGAKQNGLQIVRESA